MDDLLEYHRELFDLCAIGAEANQAFPQESFFDFASDLLSNAGILDNVEYCPYVDSRMGIKIDGYSWNNLEKVISIICLDFTNDREEIELLNKAAINKAGDRARGFTEKVGDQKYYESLAVTDPGRMAFDEIAEVLDEVLKFRVVLISDKVLSSYVKKIEIEDILNQSTSIEVWDLERIKLLDRSDADFEEFTVDILQWKEGIKVLPANTSPSGISTFLGVMPGVLLSHIYHEFGQRLLESNVRTFLDFKAATNKGMRKSLVIEPENFFAYNNGITVTASSIETIESDGQLLVTKINNMQIVNGGQTTAAIYFSPREKGVIKGEDGDHSYKNIDLEKVFVQMKLTVVNDKKTADTMKSNIATFANSQNSIQLSDLVSNHPFHLNIETRSRNQLVPAAGGVPSKWFYERARGQYNTLKRGLSATRIKKFEMEYPKYQVFSKTDMAKYENTWRMQPHTVKKGAQANLKALGAEIIKDFEKDEGAFGAVFYKDLVAKIILFKETDKAIRTADWYKLDQGLKAETVTYTLALLRYTLLGAGRDINLDLIYQKQALSHTLLSVILALAQNVKLNISNASFRGGAANPSEFCKSEKGWKKIQQMDADITSLDTKDYIDKLGIEQKKSEAVAVGEAAQSISLLEQVMNISSGEWDNIANHNARTYPVSHLNVGIPKKCAAFVRGGSMPSDKQIKLAIEVRKNAYSNGFDYIA